MVSFLNSITLWRPAIQQDKLAIDPLALKVRASLGALVTGFLAHSCLRLNKVFPLKVVSFCGPAWHYLENWRASRALDRLAVDRLEKSHTPTTDTLHYLRKRPQAITHFLSTAKQPELDATRVGEGKLNLIQTLLGLPSYSTVDLYNKSYQGLKALFSELILEPHDLKAYFMEAIQAGRNDFAVWALKYNKVNPRLLNSAETYQCWAHINSDRLARMLEKKGFDIESKNQYGNTAIQATFDQLLAQQDSPDPMLKRRFLLLLKYGAYFDFDSQVNIQQLTAEEFCASYLDLPGLRTQAQSLQGTLSSLPDRIKVSVWSFRAPAIWIGGKSQAFQVRNQVILARTMLVALPILAVLAVIGVCAVTAPVSLLASAALMGAGSLAWLYRLQHAFAAQILQWHAIREFQETKFPSHRVTQYIARSERIFDLLLNNQSIDLSKLDDAGENLWDLFCTPDSGSFKGQIPTSTKLAIFKKLAGRIFASQLTLSQKYRYFLKTLEAGYTEYVKYLVETRKIESSEFNDRLSAYEQVRYGAAASQNPQTVDFLRSQGFTSNAFNSERIAQFVLTQTRN